MQVSDFVRFAGATLDLWFARFLTTKLFASALCLIGSSGNGNARNPTRMQPPGRNQIRMSMDPTALDQ
jgi:hypothetical protein